MTTGNYQPQVGGDFDDMGDEVNDPNRVIEGSQLAVLEGLLDEDTRLDNITYRLKARKSMRLILDPNIDAGLIQRWRRSAIVGKKKTGADVDIDGVKLCAIVIGNTLAGIEVLDKTSNEWKEVLDDDSRPITFTSPVLRRMLLKNSPDTSSVVLVKKLFGNDGDLLLCSQEIMEAAGFGEDEDEEDDLPLP